MGLKTGNSSSEVKDKENLKFLFCFLSTIATGSRKVFFWKYGFRAPSPLDIGDTDNL
jgi:hypothetical protein